MIQSTKSSATLPFLALVLLAQAATAETIDIQGHPVLVDSSSIIVVDGEILPPGSPVPDKPGLRAEARFVTSATHAPQGAVAAATVIFSYAVRGSVTSIDPLRVLGQEVTVTGDTGSTGLPGGSIDNVAVGDHLDVSGYVDVNSSLQASYIEYLPALTPRWLLSGYVTASSASEIELGPQRVSLTGVVPDDCGDTIDVGAFVEIRADGIADFTAGSVLDTVTRLTCVVPMPLGTPGSLGALNGVVGTILSDSAFEFGPYVVTHGELTEFQFGSPDDLAPGATIEVDGVFGENLEFAADGIQFDSPTIRIEGPVTPADVVAGPEGTVHVLANTVRRSAQLRDEDLIYANGLNQTSQVEVRGYVDSQGVLWATRARLRGAPDPGDSRAAGPVDSANRPILSVLGLTLDLTGVTDFEDPAENPINADTFFLGAVPGAIVEQQGSWNGVDTLSGGVAALVAEAPTPPAEPLRALIVGTFGGGDLVFANGFD